MMNNEWLAQIEGRASRLMTYFGPDDKGKGGGEVDDLVAHVCDDDVPQLVTRVRELEEQVVSMTAERDRAYDKWDEHDEHEAKQQGRIVALEAQAGRDAKLKEIAALIVANARKKLSPSRSEGKRIYGDLPYFTETVWQVEDADFQCLRIAALAAREQAE